MKKSVNVLKSATKKFVLICLGAVFITACSKSDSDYSTILIEGGETFSLTLEKIAGNIGLVKLETSSECMVGDGFDLKLFENEFYILDLQASKKLFHFGEDGSFKKSVGKIGRGPGEYYVLHDFIVNDKGIEFLCGFPDTEVYFFDHNGSYEKKSKIYDFMVSYSFIRKPKSEDYYIYSPHASHKVSQFNLDSETKVDSMLPAIFGSDMIFQYFPFCESGDQSILFNEPYGNFIYELNSAGSKEKYLLDFGRFGVDPNISQGDLREQAEEFGLWEVKKVLDNDNYLYVCADKLLPGDLVIRNHFIYRKEDGQTIKLPGKNDIFSCLNPGFALNGRDELYLCLLPSEAIENDFWKTYFRDKELVVDLNDNPIIVKLSLGFLLRD